LFRTNYLVEEPSAEPAEVMHLTAFINPRPSLYRYKSQMQQNTVSPRCHINI